MSVASPALEPERAPRVARYNMTAIVLHWLVAAMLVIAVCFGLLAANADDAHVRPLIDTHKSLGLTLLGLITLRVLWRLSHRPPPLPASYPPRERFAARSVHAVLYAIMLLLPVTGYIHDSAWKLAATHPIVLYGLVPFPRIGWIESLNPVLKEDVHAIFGAAHVYAGYALYALVGLHLLGVVKHHAIDHEDELQRMLPARTRPPEASS